MRDESRPLDFPVLLAVSGSPSRLSSSLKSREFHGFDTPKVKGAASHEPFGLGEREEILTEERERPARASSVHGAVTHRPVVAVAAATAAVEEAELGVLPDNKPWLKRLNALHA